VQAPRAHAVAPQVGERGGDKCGFWKIVVHGGGSGLGRCDVTPRSKQGRPFARDQEGVPSTSLRLTSAPSTDPTANQSELLLRSINGRRKNLIEGIYKQPNFG
jgi:hypothetical protein